MCVRIVAVADLPTRFGPYQVVAFHSPHDGLEHAALVRATSTGANGSPSGSHSECLTGDAFGSLRCDCRDQLESLARDRPAPVGDHPLPAPGGPRDRLREQDQGLPAPGGGPRHHRGERGARLPGGRARLRRRRPHALLAERALDPVDVEQPEEDRRPEGHGVVVDDRDPIVVPANVHNVRYLETKRLKAGHLLPQHPVKTADRQLRRRPADLRAR